MCIYRYLLLYIMVYNDTIDNVNTKNSSSKISEKLAFSPIKNNNYINNNNRDSVDTNTKLEVKNKIKLVPENTI